MSEGRILVLDERGELADQLRARLPSYSFERQANVGEAVPLLRQKQYALTLIDLAWAGGAGLDLCRFISEELNGAVILTSPHKDPADCVLGLEMGADDFVVKPINIRELAARIGVVLNRRRASPPGFVPANEAYHFGDWRLDTGARELSCVDGKSETLSSIEFALLHAFLTHPKTVLTRAMLIDLTRTDGIGVASRAVDNQVSRLRKRLGAAAHYIRTVRDGGYVFSADVNRAG